MIGDRIGYVMSNNKALVEDIAITLGYRFASGPNLSQHAFNSVFSNQAEINEYIDQMISSYDSKAKFLVSGLRSIGFNAIDLEGGMFSMTEVKSVTGMSGTEFSQYLLK